MVEAKKSISLEIQGMHCASCAIKIEKKLSEVSGIEKASVNFALEKAYIAFDDQKVSKEKIKKTISDTGYEVIEDQQAETRDHRHAHNISNLKRGVFIGGILSLLILLGSMPELFPFAKLLQNNFVLFLLAVPVQFFLGFQFYRGFWIALKNKTADMDSLVAIGSSAAFLYSAAVTFFPGYFTNHGLQQAVYFDTAAIIITLILLGRYFEALAKGRASKAIEKLLHLQAKSAHLQKGADWIEVPVQQLQPGDIVLVKDGEKIPTDGVIVKGEAFIDQSMITGESMPVQKKVNDIVVGATLNTNGLIQVRITKVGNDTALAQIVKLVEQAQATKAPIQRLADKIASIFVPVVLVIAVLTFATWYFVFSQTFAFALTMFITVVIVACPCALGLATPTAIMVGTGKGAEHGILIKGGDVLEKTRNLDVVVFDKTGTVTTGKTIVTDIIPLADVSKEKLLHLAGILEKGSTHPLAQAITQAALLQGEKLFDPDSYRSIAGKGIQGSYMKRDMLLGNTKLMEEFGIDFTGSLSELKQLESQGKTALLFASNRKIIGLIAIADAIKNTSQQAVQALEKQGIAVFLLTGDNQKTAEAVASQLGIRNVLAEVLPENKVETIKKLQAQGKKVAMVGDGINDAPALAQADLGIAMRSGTDIAIEAGEIVLMKNDTQDVVKAIRLSRLTLQKIKQNLFWASIYNILLIPIAAGALFSFGIFLQPVFAAFAMAFSSVSVVGNSLLLKRAKL